MIYKNLGSTGLKVSLLGLGALPWGSVGTKEVSRFVDVAEDAGVNYIDTARIYGDSEATIGPALKGRRDRFVLSTKGIHRGLDLLRADLETSFTNLQTDYIDIFYIHSVSEAREYEILMRDGAYDYLATLKEQGRVRHIAVSSHNLETAKMLVHTGHFEVIMLSYNPADRDCEADLLPLCTERGVGVVVMKPLGGGVLTEVSAAQYNIKTTASASLAFCLANPHISTVIPGFDKMEYLVQNLATASHFEAHGYTQADRDTAIASVTGLGQDFCRGCGYCKPCPQSIDIPDLMGLYSKYRIFENRNWQQTDTIHDDYIAREVKGDACIACGGCEERCPYKLPISETMAKMASWR